jgi:hypothetical protein
LLSLHTSTLVFMVIQLCADVCDSLVETVVSVLSWQGPAKHMLLPVQVIRTCACSAGSAVQQSNDKTMNCIAAAAVQVAPGNCYWVHVAMGYVAHNPREAATGWDRRPA